MQSDWKAAETSPDVQVHPNLYFLCLSSAGSKSHCAIWPFAKIIHHRHCDPSFFGSSTSEKSCSASSGLIFIIYCKELPPWYFAADNLLSKAWIESTLPLLCLLLWRKPAIIREIIHSSCIDSPCQRQLEWSEEFQLWQADFLVVWFFLACFKTASTWQSLICGLPKV